VFEIQFPSALAAQGHGAGRMYVGSRGLVLTEANVNYIALVTTAALSTFAGGSALAAVSATIDGGLPVAAIQVLVVLAAACGSGAWFSYRGII
jgi:hypothetical protein